MRAIIPVVILSLALFSIAARGDETDLVWSSFLGGSGSDYGAGGAVDGFGNIYVTGRTSSSNFPTTAGAYDPVLNGDPDAFVTKFNLAGNGLDYSTFLGGGIKEYGQGIAVDGSGCAYVVGITESADFPVTAGTFDSTYNGLWDVFVAKLNPAGSALDYATFLGGGGDDGDWLLGNASIAVDSCGKAYITGQTKSIDFPTTAGAFDITHNGLWDVFVARLNLAGTALEYATFLGGAGDDEGRGITLDGYGCAYVTGKTDGGGFPTTAGAFDMIPNGLYDVFVTKLHPSGTALHYSTFLGGSGYDQGYGIALDGCGCAYVTGRTMSSSFPITSGAFDETHNGSADVFITKLNPSGSTLAYSTYLGGNSAETGFSIAVDGFGRVQVTGGTWGADFPATPGAFDSTFNGVYDVFVTKLNAAGSALDYSTFIGGSGDEESWGICLDSYGFSYVIGTVWGADFPTTPGAFDTTRMGFTDVFVTKLLIPPPPTICYCIGGTDFSVYWDLLDYYGYTLEVGDYVYAAWTGADDQINPPSTSEGIGEVTGDDVLLVEGLIEDWGFRGFGLALNVWSPGEGHPVAGERIYCRIFDGPKDELTHSNYYGDSQLYQCLYIDQEEFHCLFPGDPGNGHTDTPLSPVSIELLSFEALGRDGEVLLEWRTASERDCFGFHLERSVDGEIFDRITTDMISAAGSSEKANVYAYLDRKVTNGTTYSYNLIEVNVDGSEQLVNELAVSATPRLKAPKVCTLHQNYPNPFNPYTQINYQIPKDNHVTLKIYNLLGQEIITLIDDQLTAGSHTATWNGRDSSSNKVSAGIYFCTMEAGEFTQTRKMVLLW